MVRNNFPYLHRRIWAHSVVARRLFSQLNKRLAPSRASQFLGAKRGVIPDHILKKQVRAGQVLQKGQVTRRVAFDGDRFGVDFFALTLD